MAYLYLGYERPVKERLTSAGKFLPDLHKQSPSIFTAKLKYY